MNEKPQKKTERLDIRVTPKQKMTIIENAQNLGMKYGEYMIDRSIKGKAANRYANRKAANGIVRINQALYETLDALAQNPQETFTKAEVFSLFTNVRQEVDNVWHR